MIYKKEETRVYLNLSLYDCVRRELKDKCSHIKHKKYLNYSDTVFKKYYGKYVFSHKRNKVLKIKEVLKHWHWGWYYVAVGDDKNRSSCMIILKNISCVIDTIVKATEENKKDLYLLR